MITKYFWGLGALLVLSIGFGSVQAADDSKAAAEPTPVLLKPEGQQFALLKNWTFGNQRPEVICSQLRTGLSYKEAARTQQPYLNQDCFTNPGDNVPGNAPRHFSNLRGDGIRNLDMTLSKEFNVRENVQVQIRAEAFNVANRQRFAFPDVGSGDGSFGGVFSTANNFRRMQFGTRVQF